MQKAPESLRNMSAQNSRPSSNVDQGANAKAATRLSLLFAIALMTLSAPSELRADPYTVCIICNEPGKIYQCSLEMPLNKVPNQKGVQFACIKEIAQYGDHGQCATVRKAPGTCQGEPYRLKNTAELWAPQQTDQEREQQAEKAAPPVRPNLVDDAKTTYKNTKETVEKGYDKTKETVKEGYDKTTSTVTKTVKNVGDSISDAASTTYDCLTSFFQKCGN